ncbi:5-amino-6-(5-phosphoribosylamino)uracil reductase [Corynebacterium kalinowskii]|uniref:5-amino-6-(5-phosphoribosylamino)uracil reductase n=1 Tax=Corynebacterium kalinowskii TaxID=2675216 RepID=A0A6B8VQN8_9CORY|nr:pyrimidine reductase family protein [Corynebacterium kalinowskii]QGU02171.1 5-amino-6-(5-phosphoribosylamino)uracil reductase [Corynebacterium kalinowskii]
MPTSSLSSLIGPVLAPTMPEVRAICVSSINGKASLNGRSHGLGSPLDFELLNSLRQWSDCVLVGRKTVVSENYFGVRTNVGDKETRLLRGQSPVPPICVVTRSLDIDPNSQFFTDTSTPPLILVPENTSVTEHGRLLQAAGASIHEFSASALDKLHSLGFRRILVEGGPQLIGALLSQGSVDKLHVTVAPWIVWSDEASLLQGIEVTQKLELEHHAADEDGCVFLRYRVRK